MRIDLGQNHKEVLGSWKYSRGKYLPRHLAAAMRAHGARIKRGVAISVFYLFCHGTEI